MTPIVSKTANSSMAQWEDPIHLTNHYKTETCKKYATRTVCDYVHCPFYHGRKERRRSFEVYSYTSQACEHVKVGEEWKDSINCPNKDECPKCHTRMEQQFHPEVYKKMQCKDLQTGGACPRGAFCAFAHHDGEIQGKRNPEWNFDWAKILPPGVQAQYNTTKKGCGGGGGKKIESITSKPNAILPLIPTTTITRPVKSTALDKIGCEFVFIESPKIPEKLQYTFAAILAGKQDDAPSSLMSLGNENNEYLPQQQLHVPDDDDTLTVPPTSSSLENQKEVIIRTEDDLQFPLPPTPCFAPVSIISGSGGVRSNSFAASFADILSGAKTRLEALPNRLGSLNALIKKSSRVELPSILSPLLTLRGDAAKNNSEISTNNEDISIVEISRSPSISSPSDRCTCRNQLLDVFDAESLHLPACVIHSETTIGQSRERTLTEEYEDVSDLDVDTVTLFDSSRRKLRKEVKHNSIANCSQSSSSSDLSGSEDSVFKTEKIGRRVDTHDSISGDIHNKKQTSLNYTSPNSSNVSPHKIMSEQRHDNNTHANTSDNKRPVELLPQSLAELCNLTKNTDHYPLQGNSGVDFTRATSAFGKPCSTATCIGPPPGFGYHSSPPRPVVVHKPPDYAMDILDEGFWIALEDYPSRYNVREEDFFNIVEKVQNDIFTRMDDNNSMHSNNHNLHDLQRRQANAQVFGSGDGYKKLSTPFRLADDRNSKPIRMLQRGTTIQSMSHNNYNYNNDTNNNSYDERNFCMEEQLEIDVPRLAPVMENEMASLYFRNVYSSEAELYQNSSWTNQQNNISNFISSSSNQQYDHHNTSSSIPPESRLNVYFNYRRQPTSNSAQENAYQQSSSNNNNRRGESFQYCPDWNTSEIHRQRL